MDASLVPERLIVTLSGLFGSLGALLAAIGTFGLPAYSVARRSNEIGVRWRWAPRGEASRGW